MPKVSIIVPIYNAEHYLSRTVDAILAQEESDWELILIDDGSVDQSPLICDRYAAQDSRIIVRHIPNGGVANARNVGLEAASGALIAFCDSDDYYSPAYLKTMLAACGDVDLAICGLFVDTENASTAHPVPFTGILSEENFSVLVESWFDIYWMGLWNKLFAAATIKKFQLRFETGLSMSEDAVFVLSYLLHVQRIACIDTPLYHYVQQNTNSLTHRFNNDALYGFDITASLLHQLAGQHACDGEKITQLCLERRSSVLSGYVYFAMADVRVNVAKKKAVCAELRQCKAERKLLQKNGGLTQKIISTANFPLLRIYFWLLELRK